MPRRKIKFVKYTYYHAFNRGVVDIFRNDNDVKRFIKKIVYYAAKFNIHICSYAIMKNHFHFLVMSRGDNNGITEFFKKLQQSHSVYFNIKYRRTGCLFESRFKAKVTTKEDYFCEVQRYILKNPLKVKYAYSEKGVSGNGTPLESGT